MELELIGRIIDLGGTVAVVGIFIWYLYNRNGKQERAMDKVADHLDTIGKNQARHTKVLIRVANNHGLKDDADDLMKT